MDTGLSSRRRSSPGSLPSPRALCAPGTQGFVQALDEQDALIPGPACSILAGSGASRSAQRLCAGRQQGCPCGSGVGGTGCHGRWGWTVTKTMGISGKALSEQRRQSHLLPLLCPPTSRKLGFPLVPPSPVSCGSTAPTVIPCRGRPRAPDLDLSSKPRLR